MESRTLDKSEKPFQALRSHEKLNHHKQVSGTRMDDVRLENCILMTLIEWSDQPKRTVTNEFRRWFKSQ